MSAFLDIFRNLTKRMNSAISTWIDANGCKKHVVTGVDSIIKRISLSSGPFITHDSLYHDLIGKLFFAIFLLLMVIEFIYIFDT